MRLPKPVSKTIEVAGDVVGVIIVVGALSLFFAAYFVMGVGRWKRMRGMREHINDYQG